MAYSSNDSSPQQPSQRAEKPKDDPRRDNVEGLWSNLQNATTALKRGVCLGVTYEGLRRVVEVHTVGMGRGQGKAAISAYQVDGDCHAGKPEGWLLMYLDECFEVELSNRTSKGPRPGYAKGCKGFMRIDAEV